MITKLQIMKWFEMNRKGTVKQLVEELGGKGERVATVICGLVKEGVLTRSASTGMGTRCRIYELSEGKTNRQRMVQPLPAINWPLSHRLLVSRG
ncbi:hypothetical protein HIK33_09940 [Cronobacter sakazakii]|nr:hypothetical protein FZI48_12245 [Cronobacter sakazakii]MBF4646222.1 hypothetical protein [Cronobacter sakazakii]MBF4668355.1 hypothetical protein [Cronobacter sakazakii]MBF4882436.1 hypothetical protein [Cronobacter sakazakii]MDI9307992.1 hypothetical protein [Cronobacter sakazakii]